jgi:small subunit ribosomal protein S1
LFDDTATPTQELESPVTETPSGNETHDVNASASAADLDEKPASEDFAAALESFTAETEEAAANDDKVIKGTVLKLTPTHVVVDIGTKSEGMLPLSEVMDHEGNPKFKPGDEIEVMHQNLGWKER